MRIAAGLLGLTLLGCQSSPAPTSASAPEPLRVVTSAAPEVVPPSPRRPLARLNPRRQKLEVGEAPLRPQPRPQKVGVVVVTPTPPQRIAAPVPPPPAPRPNPPVYYAPPTQSQVSRQPSVPVQGWPPPALEHLEQARRAQARADEFMAQEQERIRRNNEMLMNRPLPGGGMTPQMQQIAYPQASRPQFAPTAFSPGTSSSAHQAAERRYLEARADFLNTKYIPNGMPPRYTPDNVRGMVGTGMPLPPQMMNQPAMFNPVLQKAQQAEVLRQEMQRTP